ncbi:MAG: hypothetical protein P1U56_05765 [Saprospiraceae bacterium]|nr:hypothetical protein [Saprospiraceae bacterium]
MASFLSNEQDLGLLLLEMEIKDFGMISIQEDRQCVFQLLNKNHLFQLIQRAVPPTHQNLLVKALLNQSSKYINVDVNNEIKHYHTLEEIHDC